MKKLLFLACLSVATIGSLNSQTAAAARAAGVGNNTSVRGVAINGPELGIIRYIQDVTGGIAGYGGNLSTINRGDSVVISGPLSEYYNLYEIAPPTFLFISANAKIPAPQVITPAQFTEAYEGVLIKIKNCTFSASGTFTGTGNYTVTSNGQTFALRTNSLSNIVGVTIPTGTVDIIGVGSQFCGPAAGSGCTTGYQLLLRGSEDITPSAAPVGITELNRTASLQVYPNPASGSIHFRLAGKEQASLILVTDVLGKHVYSSTENESTVDVSNLRKGFYTISINTTENKNYQGKFIVE